MITVYADDRLIYDSRLDSYSLLSLTTTAGLNKSGTAAFTMPPGHPAYNAFISYRTIVTIYENGIERFRGRVLYPDDDLYNCRTLTCEGERGFLRDAIARPYLYQDTPAAIFAAGLELYNGDVDEFKRFTLGEVTVTDPNDYVRLESTAAENFAAFFDKLVERCGGYITFSDDGNGGRAINWLAEVGTQNNQGVEFGENLLDFARSGQSPELATAIRPYGAQLEDGSRVTIASVTEDGADWIIDEEAVALRGIITGTQTWDDVTDPVNLLAKAKQWLAAHRLAITSLQLTAADLSRLGYSLDSFKVGDLVRVKSKPHNVDEWFQLTDQTTDWLNPAGGSITLGKTQSSLTGADVAGDRGSQSALERVKREVVSDYQVNVAKAIQEATTQLSSLIEQTAEDITSTVSKTYTTGDDVTSLVQSKIEQLSESIEFTFTQLRTDVTAADGAAADRLDIIEKYIRFEDGNIILGESGNELTLKIENDRISFLDGGAEVAYMSNKQLYITDAHFLNSLRLGKFAWIPRANGNLSLVKVGD